MRRPMVPRAPPPAPAEKPPAVFLLKHILHDWPDAHAARILAHIVPAMRAGVGGSRILIVEDVVPPPGTVPPAAARLVSTMDLDMMVCLAAKERSADQWAALLRAAHPKLALKAVHSAPLSAFAVVEAVLEE
jgi:hypothetical protein